MIQKKIFVLAFIILLTITIYPASAAVATVDRWVLNVIMNDDGTVQEIIQTEIDNGGSTPLDGFSFVVPAAKVSQPNITTFSPNGQEVLLQTVPGGTKIVVNFNTILETGQKWDGRIDFNAENWIVKEDQNYSIKVPVEAPQAIIAGTSSGISAAAEPEIRSQVFLPKYADLASVEPSGYKELLQYNSFAGEEIIVLTWFQLKFTDIISVEASHSDMLNKIVDTDEKLRNLSGQIKNANATGNDVTVAQAHLKNAEDYKNQAQQLFFEKQDATASMNAENDEIMKAEDSLSLSGKTQPATLKPSNQKTPGFEILSIIPILVITFMLRKKKMM
jgi:hypothetical protein